MRSLDVKAALDKIMSDGNEPPADLVVVGRLLPEDEGLSDHQLEHNINKTKSILGNRSLTRNLKDNGMKLMARLRALECEKERRERALSCLRNDAVDGEREGMVRTEPSKPSTVPNSASQSPSSFFDSFYKKLEANDKSGPAFKDELRSVQRKYGSQKEIKLQNVQGSNHRLQHRPISYKSKLSNFVGQRSVSGYYKDHAVSQISSPNFVWHTKRGEECQHVPQYLKSNKVEDVVLLDEDDVEIIHPIEDDDELLNVKIYYPNRDHADCVEISYPDIKCLDPESYLSSPIMNFYIQYLQKPIFPTGRPKSDYYFFNTYFYSKLVEALSSKSNSSTHLSKLRRWFKGTNLFQKTYIFLPVHGSLHWSLVVICIPVMEDETGPIILHLDSLRLHDSESIFENIERYLVEEWEYMRRTYGAYPQGLPISEKTWRDLPSRIIKRRVMVPQQRNEYDCGLFVLYFMERFIMEVPERVNKEDLARFGHKWFHAEEASGLRERLRELLMEEFENARLNDKDEQLSPSSTSSLEAGCG